MKERRNGQNQAMKGIDLMKPLHIKYSGLVRVGSDRFTDAAPRHICVGGLITTLDLETRFLSIVRAMQARRAC